MKRRHLEKKLVQEKSAKTLVVRPKKLPLACDFLILAARLSESGEIQCGWLEIVRVL